MGRDVKNEKQGIVEDPALEAGLAGDAAGAPGVAGGIQITMSEELEKELIEIVLDDYESAKSDRDQRDYGTTSRGTKLDFDKWRKDLLDMYNAERVPKTVPWKFCSNRSLRIAKAILDMLHARLFPSVVNENLLKFRAENVASYAKLERIEKMMHWWLFVHDKIRQFFDDWVKVNLGFGDSVTESSWEARHRDGGQTEQKPVVGPDGQPTMEADGSPSMVSSRVLDLIEKSVSRVYTRDKFFLQKGSRDIEHEPVILEDDLLYRDLESGEMQQQFVNVTNQLKDKLKSNIAKVGGLSPEEQEKIKDVKLRNEHVKILKWYGNFDADGDGFAEDIRVYVALDHRIYLGGVAMTNITKSGRRPLDFTKVESRLGDVSENFGYGILETIKELAEEVDALFNQLADGNTLAIMMPGFYDPGGDLEASSIQLQPNKMTAVSDPQRNIFFPTINAPTEKLIAAIRLVLEFIERLTAASSYVMGKESDVVGGSGTATRTNAIVSAANERFGMPAERLRQGVANIVRHHLDLLQLNIPPGLEQRILGDDGSPIFAPNELSMEGIAAEIDAYVLPDPSGGSQESAQQVGQMLYSILMQNPIVATDPVKIYKTTKKYLLEPFGQDSKEVLGPEPDDDMIDDPAQENTLIIQGQFGSVTPQFQENHMLHIQKHTELLQSPSLAAVPPALLGQITSFTQQHIMQHMQMQQMVMGMMSKLGGGGNGAPGNSESGGGSKSSHSGLSQLSGQSGMEQAPGPLGQALDAKREGESGGGQGR
jgi:hypothetical protein